MKTLFAFLSALYSALWELFHNGRQPLLNIREFVLAPEPVISSREMLPGERVYREGHANALDALEPGQARPAVTLVWEHSPVVGNA